MQKYNKYLSRRDKKKDMQKENVKYEMVILSKINKKVVGKIPTTQDRL